VLLESGDAQPLDTLVEVEVSEVRPVGDGFSVFPAGLLYSRDVILVCFMAFPTTTKGSSVSSIISSLEGIFSGGIFSSIISSKGVYYFEYNLLSFRAMPILSSLVGV